MSAVAARPYELVIGLECHVELATASKMFCGCPAKHFAAPPNTQVCPVCLGLPGALPVPNRHAIELAMLAGLALDCRVPEHTKFDRKNYLYPDLPKGYQISQYDLPLSVEGSLHIPADGGGTKRVGIRRAHLEEDTGRLLHGEDAGKRYTLVDFNRSGVPLLEIVSDPDLSSTAEALAYLDTLRERLVFSGVSEFRLEEGAGRFDVNVSIRFEEEGETRWPPQSEIKNLNSFRALEQSVAYEADRLWDEWRAGGDLRTRSGKITVGWSPERGRTFLQRSKEEVEDYRYFPEPDLVTFQPSAETVAALRAALPEMPADRRARFARDYGLSEYDARILVADRALADWYEAAVAAAPEDPKAVANWVTTELLGALKAEPSPLEAIRVTPAGLGALVTLIRTGEISGKTAKDVFAEMWRTGADPAEVVRTKGLGQIGDESAIGEAVEAVVAESAKAVSDYRGGNARALGAIIGKVQARMKGRANPTVLERVLRRRLG
ncbi:MAG TPA: Asp-tRNA(Asn)/Glu-tRNA(Gln) amidotransferase subunit GatB [Candidatus Limnocylindrales bacterium]|nr:Asp-tRNA(Asn)/Glu-tRNA(Gln) amidotransferase subunit GatB [Candidatus Limnocylindrales bacterium]